MSAVIVACLAALIVRIAYWQVVRGEELTRKAENQQQGNSIVTASRGKIYDRNGKVLAESASVNTLVCNPKDVEDHGDADFISESLAPVLDMKIEEIKELLTKDSRYQVIKKRINAEQTDAIETLRGKISKEAEGTETAEQKKSRLATAKKMQGIYFEEDSKRYYPFSVAPHVMGFTGYDNKGLQGIELTFDDELMGRNGNVFSNQNANGTTLEEQQAEYLQSAEKGDDVTLTIDETIQHFLEKHLEEAVEENELKEGAAGIVMNPKTGEIYAMATKPDFDLNNPYDVNQFLDYAVDFEFPSEKDDNDDEDEDEDEDKPRSTPRPTANPQNLSDEDTAAVRNKMWRNKAISDSYEPGSTFKIMTAAAALEEHVVDLNSQFYCPGFKIVEDRNISCAAKEGHGPETFVEGVQNSCNPVFMELGLRLGEEKFMEYFTAFGLTEPTNIELVGESGSIYYKNGMNNVDIATSSFGQGFQVTPIQLITAVSAVINGGERIRPHIVKEIRNETGVLKSYEREVVNRVISEDTSAKMREILESVVSSPNATGKNAYVKGCRIGGKTGTSEKGNRDEHKRIASFIGFAPANDPEVVCLIMLDEPQVDNYYGGTIAAPVAGEVIEDTLNCLGIEKQYTEDEEPDKTIEVPDMRGLSEDEAEEKLEELGFTVRVRGEGDEVVNQLPDPGIMLGDESMVILYTEEDWDIDDVTVPDLTGLTMQDARESLLAYGLNFEAVGAGHSNSYMAYAVKQSVEAGEEVPPTTVIGVEFRQAAQD